MSEEPRKIKIETLKTPKGNVPTVKGLETAINSVYSEIASLNSHLSQINQFYNQITQSLGQLSSQLDEYNKKISGLGETFADLIVHLSKVESQQVQKKGFSKKQLSIEKADLVALKEDLSHILEQLKDQVTKNEP